MAFLNLDCILVLLAQVRFFIDGIQLPGDIGEVGRVEKRDYLL